MVAETVQTFWAAPRTTPTAGPTNIYRRRVAHLRTKGSRFVGDDVADRLTNSGISEVGIIGVRGRDNYTVFLNSDDLGVVIGIGIGVDGAVANQDFDWGADDPDS
jgi:hypothetical protein